MPTHLPPCCRVATARLSNPEATPTRGMGDAYRRFVDGPLGAPWLHQPEAACWHHTVREGDCPAAVVPWGVEGQQLPLLVVVSCRVGLVRLRQPAKTGARGPGPGHPPWCCHLCSRGDGAVPAPGIPRGLPVGRDGSNLSLGRGPENVEPVLLRGETV